MRPRSSFLLRKCALICVVLIITCVTLHLRGPKKNQDNHEQQSRTPSKIEETHINRKIQEYQSTNNEPTSSKQQQTKPNENSSSSNSTKISEKGRKSKNESSRQKQSPTLKKVLSPSSSSTTKTPLTTISTLIKNCTDPAYLGFPTDVFGHKARARGAIIFHIAIILYMFYCLAIVCDYYFLPALEECAQRLNLSQDVAGATFMAAGSSAPELFTATLGVFIAKGDVGTGTIVGSAVFNILFVIGLCALYSASVELSWWPVARDSSYYAFTVLLLILFIYDGEVTTFESLTLLSFYGVYIWIMKNNIQLRDYVLHKYNQYSGTLPETLEEFEALKANNAGVVTYSTIKGYGKPNQPKITVYEACHMVIINQQFYRLFRPITRFRSAAYLIIMQGRKSRDSRVDLTQRKQQFAHPEQNATHFGKSFDEIRRESILPDPHIWQNVPDFNTVGWLAWSKWAVIAPLHAALFYTIPDCRIKQNLFLATFFMSVFWTAVFSYIMVWMVTLIGYTFGIPDSIMGITFLAAGTSIPDAYASIHVAKQGQADMAVSNSIGSNVFDILIGLALPWFIETAIVYPGTVASINSRGLVWAVIMLFLSLLITIYLFKRNNWTLNPQLGYALLTTYGFFIVFSSALEFNLFGFVNPPMCDV